MDKRANAIVLAALETLKVMKAEGVDLSFVDDIIDPNDISETDIQSLQGVFEGLSPSRLVVTLNGGIVESVCANRDLALPVEVYVSDIDCDDADENDDKIDRLKAYDGDEWRTCIRTEAINADCTFDIDANIDRIFGGK